MRRYTEKIDNALKQKRDITLKEYRQLEKVLHDFKNGKLTELQTLEKIGIIQKGGK